MTNNRGRFDGGRRRGGRGAQVERSFLPVPRVERKEDDDELIASAKILLKIMKLVEEYGITKEYTERKSRGLKGYGLLMRILNGEVSLQSRNYDLNAFAQSNSVGTDRLTELLSFMKHYEPKE
jgi:hypothetical protein